VYRDAFTKREKANEDYAIRKREQEKLLELKKKLQEQHEHLKKLEEHMLVSHRPVLPPLATLVELWLICFYSSDEISKSQGGEQK
jgi:hypothetical protein